MGYKWSALYPDRGALARGWPSDALPLHTQVRRDAHGQHTGEGLLFGRRPDGRPVRPLLPHIKEGPVPIIVLFDEGLTSR